MRHGMPALPPGAFGVCGARRAGAREPFVRQTPYLVLSREARKLLLAKREANPGLELVVATNNLAATAAQSARVWKTQDPAYAKRCLQAAEKAWKAANRHPDVFMSGEVHQINDLG